MHAGNEKEGNTISLEGERVGGEGKKKERGRYV